MESDAYDYAEVIAMLKEEDLSPEEVAKIIDHMKAYEETMATDSIMDSLANGSFDLKSLIDEALNKPSE